MKKSVITGLFFFSGALGLVYEVVWARQLTLLMGVSIYSVSAVVAAFMGGLGLGAEFFGRKLDKGLAPIRLYSLMEIGIGAYVLLFPAVLAVLQKVYVALHPGSEGISFFVLFLRFTLAVAALIIPTTLMGGTLPALSRFVSNAGDEIGNKAGWLYSINTLGAMFGCIAAGFFLVELAGFSKTLVFGGTLNLVIGVAAWLTAAEAGWTTAAQMPVEKNRLAASGSSGGPTRFFLVVFGVAGFCAMSLEVLWTRMLVLILNNTTYAFSLILVIFLSGIGAGSAFMSRQPPGSAEGRESSYALFQMGVGLFAVLSLAGFAYSRPMLGVLEPLVPAGGVFNMIIPGGRELTVAFIFSLAVLFPATFLMGGSFTMAFRAAANDSEKIGGRIGRLYAVNIIGCVLGSVLAAYLLLPLMGVQSGVLAAGWAAVVSGAFLALRRPVDKQKGTAFAAISACVVLTAVVLFSGDAAFALSLQKLDSGSRIEYYGEGPTATVLVSSQESDLSSMRAPVKRLWINGDPIAGAFREALQLERLQAHIPLLIHPSPKNALVICFGTGTTAGTATTHRLSEVTAVDISPEVFKASGQFTAANFDVARNPSVKMVVEDGRNFLLTTRKKFDFITSEPPPPSNAGIVSLYTAEYYRLCRMRLAKNGIVSQWIPLHHLSQDDFRSLVATFAEAFPYSQMWYTKWDAIMVGSAEPLVLDFNAVETGMKNEAVAASLKEIGVNNPLQLFSNYMMGAPQMRAFANGAASLFDDRPTVEFSAPRIHSQGVTIKGRNLENLLKFRTPPEVAFKNEADARLFEAYFKSQGEFLRGQVEVSDNRLKNAAAHFASALSLNKDNSDARYAFLGLNVGILYSALGKQQPDMAIKMVEYTRTLDVDGLFGPQLRFLKGMFLAEKGEITGAEMEFMEALRLDPKYFMAVVNLAGLYGFKLNNVDKARELYSYALGLGPSESEKQSILEALRKLS